MHWENEMEGYKVSCEIVLNITKLHSLSPEAEPVARNVCSRAWTDASPASMDSGLLIEKEVSYRGKPVLVRRRIFVTCS